MPHGLSAIRSGRAGRRDFLGHGIAMAPLQFAAAAAAVVNGGRKVTPTFVKKQADAGIAEIPSYEDNETSFAELQERIAKTVRYLESFAPADIDGSEERPVEMRLRGGPVTFTGQQYLLNFGMPNFYFHVVAAYAILRHNGVPLGKTGVCAGRRSAGKFLRMFWGDF